MCTSPTILLSGSTPDKSNVYLNTGCKLMDNSLLEKLIIKKYKLNFIQIMSLKYIEPLSFYIFIFKERNLKQNIQI